MYKQLEANFFLGENSTDEIKFFTFLNMCITEVSISTQEF